MYVIRIVASSEQIYTCEYSLLPWKTSLRSCRGSELQFQDFAKETEGKKEEKKVEQNI